ncbi:hypothetical protein HMI55_003758 [Coelomomyces lativittatus]|nr:hypothetical protein HMI55_003758 [Coelomomyces lativittatus]
MINLGASKSIEMEDLWDLYPNDKFRAANENYQNFVTQTTPLIFGLWRTLKHHLLLQLLTGFLASILAFSGPFFLNRILIFLEENNPTWMYGLTLVLSLFIASLTKSLLDGQTYFRGRRIGTRVRAIIIGQVYSKTLRTQNSSLNTGHVLNLMQVDTNKIVELACYLQYFFTTPFQILVAIFALYQILGWSSFAGVFVMMLVCGI